MEFRTSGDDPGEGFVAENGIGISDCRFQMSGDDDCFIGERLRRNRESANVAFVQWRCGSACVAIFNNFVTRLTPDPPATGKLNYWHLCRITFSLQDSFAIHPSLTRSLIDR